ncbi:hypothetical protein ACFL5T_01780 [Gemmatimonadota bacterium]
MILGAGRCADCGYEENGQLVAGLLDKARRLEAKGWIEEPKHILDNLLNRGIAASEVQTLRSALDARRDFLLSAFFGPLHENRLRAAAAAANELAVAIPDHEEAGKTVADWVEWLEHQLEVAIPEGLARARKLESIDRERAFFEYETLLEVCVDCREALEGIARCPPEPPASACLRRERDSSLALEWEASPSVGDVEYIVLRTTGSAAMSVSNGIQIYSGPLRPDVFDDVSDLVGTSVAYSVFACRRGVLSSNFRGTGSILVTAEVADLAAEPDDGEARLSWTAPRGVKSIRVTRKNGVPPRVPGDGHELVGTPTGLHDTGLANGIRYHYLISAVFEDPEGMARTSDGVRVDVLVDRRPTIVSGLQVSAEGGGITFSWSPPDVGAVTILRCASFAGHREGDLVRTSSLSELGETVVADQPGQTARLRDVAHGIHFFVPFSVQGDLARVGRASEYVFLPSVREVRDEKVGEAIRLRWKWPPGIELASVAWRSDRFPESPKDAGVRVKTLSQGAYHSRGGAIIEAESDSQYYFTVFGALEIAGMLHHASGVEDSARLSVSMGTLTEISYSLRPTRNWRRKVTGFELLLTADKDVNLADTVLVAKSHFVPLDPDDGNEILSLTGVGLLAGRCHRVGLDRASLSETDRVRMFFVDQDAYKRARLIEE